MSMKKIQTNIFICIIVFISGSANAGSYEDGIVAYSRRDYQTASKLFRNGADRGDSKAQYQLSIMYDKGQGVTQDYKEAVKWFQLSADQGDANAQYNLGVMYANGQGVTQDDIKAHMWLNISAMAGNEKAKTARDIVAKKMSQTQIEKAQEMARRCQSSNFKNCD